MDVIDVLDSLLDMRYPDPFKEMGLQQAIQTGLESAKFVQLLAWLAKELKATCKLEAQVSSADSSSLLQEVSCVLKELGCTYTSLTEAPLRISLRDAGVRYRLLDYLTTELQAARMISIKPELDAMQVESEESETAKELTDMISALALSQPPQDITIARLFTKVERKLRNVTQDHPNLVKPAFMSFMSDEQWNRLGDIQVELHREYTGKREALIGSFDETIRSVMDAADVEAKDAMAKVYEPVRSGMDVSAYVQVHHLLSARADLPNVEEENYSPKKAAVNGQAPPDGPKEHEPPSKEPDPTPDKQGQPQFHGHGFGRWFGGRRGWVVNWSHGYVGRGWGGKARTYNSYEVRRGGRGRGRSGRGGRRGWFDTGGGDQTPAVPTS